MSIYPKALSNPPQAYFSTHVTWKVTFLGDCLIFNKGGGGDDFPFHCVRNEILEFLSFLEVLAAEEPVFFWVFPV